MRSKIAVALGTSPSSLPHSSNGRLLVIGFASGTIPKLPANLALVKNYSLVGVFWGEFTRREPSEYAENIRELFGWYAEGKIRPVIGGEHALSEAGTVLETILARGASGKHVLVPDGRSTV